VIEPADANIRTHSLAIVPRTDAAAVNETGGMSLSLHGTFLTGEMFAPVLREQIVKVNALINSNFHVLAVPNTYFGGDVSVAGLLTGEDLLAARRHVRGSFVIIPGSMLKSGEEIMLDGQTLTDVRRKFELPVQAMDFQSFSRLLSAR
jgi:NifB/MoaA-like Fe-S oxidoreductase